MSASNGQRRKRAVLAMPAYGGVSTGAARSFFRSSTCEHFDLAINALESSMLTANFNNAWAGALNEKLAGKHVDYFAMVHSDVAAEDHWLDTLVEELERKGLDVLSALIPIKDGRGVTSTALGNAADEWVPRFRLTMADAYRLPETFTAADLGHPGDPLYINTGLWVCRFGEWAKQVHFEVRNKIFLDPKTGRYRERNMPEDWLFGRRCWELGLKVAATRIVQVKHRGPTDWTNTRPWGDWEWDREYRDAPAVPGPAAPDGWRWPSDVEGWLTQDEGKALAALAAGKRVLEVGCHVGRSTICMAQAAQRVVCVDTFDARGTCWRGRDTLPEFTANLERYGLAHKVGANRGEAAEVLSPYQSAFQPGTFDMVFVDGDHSYDAARADVLAAAEMVKPGGLIAVHDYRNKPGEYDGGWDEGVTRAVNEFLSAGWHLHSRTGTIAVLRPPAPAPLAPELPAEPAGVTA